MKRFLSVAVRDSDPIRNFADIEKAIAEERATVLRNEMAPEAQSRAPRPAPPPPGAGPGTELKGLLRLVGITATPTCPCNARAAQMDVWGPDECERRLDEIVDWLEQEAGSRRLPFSRYVAGKVVKLAIRRARAAAS